MAVRRDPVVAGQRYGRLTTLAPTDRRSSKSIVWLCLCDCGELVHRSAKAMKAGDARSCGCLFREYHEKRRANALRKLENPNEPSWGLTSEGYVCTQIAGRTILQHRYIMERHLGRELLPEETVHHLNGVRNDNRIENLELWSKSHPAGQRVADKVAWAIDILKTYANTDFVVTIATTEESK